MLGAVEVLQAGVVTFGSSFEDDVVLSTAVTADKWYESGTQTWAALGTDTETVRSGTQSVKAVVTSGGGTWWGGWKRNYDLSSYTFSTGDTIVFTVYVKLSGAGEVGMQFRGYPDANPVGTAVFDSVVTKISPSEWTALTYTWTKTDANTAPQSLNVQTFLKSANYTVYYDDFSIVITAASLPVPEAATLSLLALPCVALQARRSKR